MFNSIKKRTPVAIALLLAVVAGCKKGTFDINSTNPNVPSTVSPKYILSAALLSTARLDFGGGVNFLDRYMGYWAFSGDYGGYGTEASYNLTSTFNSGNWDTRYTTIENYRFIENTAATSPAYVFYRAIAKIMEAYEFQKLVDIYNNVPYTDALKGGTVNYPKYDKASDIYTSLVHQVDSAIAIIKAGQAANANPPGNDDILFGGDMGMWLKFANTEKLKLLLNLTQTSGGPAFIQSELSGLTPANFLGAGEDAAINPGYSNSSGGQQSPQWGDVGYTTSGSLTGDHQYVRANSYAVNFYLSTNDPRASRFYTPNSAGVIRGRAYGSQDGSEHNSVISAVGPGILQSPKQPSVIIPAFESLFMQAEAAQRGYISGTASTLYQSAITESFRLLWANDASFDYQTAATNYYSQSDVRVNWASASSDPITLILTQEWAALNAYDPLQAWSNWRRLNIPADLPVSIYPGTQAPHIPVRLLYPASEYSYNAANVNGQGTISPITSKIFWMP